ncbi:MAG: hypothetical protein NVS3B10_15020 [Polyangiales bacterium]
MAERAASSALACPSCEGPLVLTAQAAQCARCERTWPRIDGVIDFLAPPEHTEDDRARRP